jgi:hypothetical protein
VHAAAITRDELEDTRAAFERSLATGKRGKVVLRVAGDETAA